MSWEMVKLSEVSSFIRNGLSIKQDSSLSGVPITRIETISDRTVNLEKCGYADLKPTDNLDYKLEKGDILISHINSPKHLGKSAQFHGEEHLIHGMNLLCLRPNDKIDARYLYLAINSSHFLNQLPNISNKSVNQASFKVSDFKNLNVHLPPLPEQQRIADILDKAEAITQKREQALSLCDEFLRATFLDMFGDPVSNPKGWDVERLESFILHMNNGLSRRRKVQENVGDIVLRLQDIQYDGIGFEKELNRVELDEDEKKRYKLLTGDILFVRVNGNPDYVGRSAIFNGYKEPIFHNDHLIRIRLNEKLLPEYLVFLLHSDVENNLISQQIKTSAGQHTISQKGINDIEIPIPSVELQQEFIAVVEKVNAIKARIQYAQELPLFDALSQQAFKGELTQ